MIRYRTEYAHVVAVTLLLVLAGCPSSDGPVDINATTTEVVPDTQTAPHPNSTPNVSTPATTSPPAETTREPTKSITDTLTQTATSARPTTTPSNSNHPYREFAFVFNQTLGEYAAVPLNILAYGNRTNTWYVVIDSTAPSVDQNRHDAQWQNIARAYASAVVFMDRNVSEGEVPEQMTLLDWNSSGYQLTPGTYTVQTEWARALGNETISIGEYEDRWVNTIRNQTEREQQLARELDSQAENRTYYNSTDS